MFGELQLERIEELRIRLAYGSVRNARAHDVFLLDLHLPTSTEPFDESIYLASLEAVVDAHPAVRDPCVLRRCRTHRSGTGAGGEAEISISLSTASRSAVEPSSLEAITTAFRSILRDVGGGEARALSREEAVTEARLRVAQAYPDVGTDALALTEEEHHATAGTWSVGLGLHDVARFKVLLGFVDGVSGTAHIRRMPASEVVDSVGTD